MRKFIAMLMTMGALACILYIGVTAIDSSTPNASSVVATPSNESTVNSDNTSVTDTSSEDMGLVSLESIATSSKKKTSSKKTSSKKTSSILYGQNAYDLTGSAEAWGDTSMDATLDYEEEKETSSKKVTTKKENSNGMLYVILLILCAVFAVGSVAALVYVNRKSFAGDKGSKKAKRKNKNKKQKAKKE